MTKQPISQDQTVGTRTDGRAKPWKESEPFVENKRGQLIHRVRYVTTYNIHRTPHLAVTFMCGASTTGREDTNLTFLPTVPKGKPLCEFCEYRAKKMGQKSAETISRRHVCTGHTKVVKTCGCKE